MADILREDPPLHEIRQRESFMNACNMAYRIGSCLLRTSVVLQQRANQQTQMRVWFHLRKQGRPLNSKISDLKSLNAKLADISKAELLGLAFRVAESGLVLMGTPWLLDISCVSLKYLKANGQGPQYLIDVSENRSSLRLLLENAKPRQIIVHSYIYAIGAVLV